MVTLPQLRDGYVKLNSRILRNSGAFASQLFKALPDWRNENAAEYKRLVDANLTAAKVQAARIQNAYYAEVAKVSGETYTPVVVRPADVATPALRNGVPFEEVWQRPFVSMYTELSRGNTVSGAIAAGAARAFQLATTEVQLATTHTGRRVRGNNNNIVGYRRVLSGSENCALCAIASTQRYRSGDLKPIHPGCDCGEEPIYGDVDPGQIIDPGLLEDTHLLVERTLETTSDRGARDAGLSKVIESPTAGDKLADYTDLIITRNHGEYGPTLSFRDQRFTSARDIPAVLDSGI